MHYLRYCLMWKESEKMERHEMVDKYKEIDNEPKISTNYMDMTVMSGEGMIGDCFRACIATIIGKKTEGVPHFGLLGDLHAMETAIAWLNYYGYEVGLNQDDWLDEGLSPMPLHLIKGYSHRGIYHAVVGDTTTGEMVHDPHPSRAGINGVNGRIYIFKRYNKDI